MSTRWNLNDLQVYIADSSNLELTNYLKGWISAVLDLLGNGKQYLHYKEPIGDCKAQSSRMVRPFSEIPQKKGWPLVGCLLEYYQNLGKTHKLLAERSRILGPIFKEKVGSTEIVFVSSLDDIKRMIKVEGRNPRHFDVPPWLEYRTSHHRACGILTAQGETWSRMRHSINKRLLRTKHVAEFCPDFNAVTDDFLQRLTHVRNSENIVEHLEEELLKWALESTGTVLLEKRLGCLDSNISLKTQIFIKAACDVFKHTQKLIYLPNAVAKVITPTAWKQHTECWDVLFTSVQQLVDERITEISENEGCNEGGFLTHLLSQNISREEIYANVIELLVGGIHTTTKVLQWLLYEMSKSEDCQEKLYEEVSQYIPSKAPIVLHQLDELSYPRAILNETLRLYPVAGGIPRILSNHVTLSGYEIPKGTNVMVLSNVIGRNPELFKNPDSFLPERWLGEITEKMRLLSTLPFGMGTRMCVGKRIAETEIGIFLTRISQKFALQPITSEPLEIESCLFIQPARPVRLRFLDRE